MASRQLSVQRSPLTAVPTYDQPPVTAATGALPAAGASARGQLALCHNRSPKDDVPRRTSRHSDRRDPDQCLDTSMMTTSVVLGSCSSRPDRLSSVQLATFTTLADWAADPADSAGSTMLSPWLSSKNVCSPNKSLSCGITGWSSGMARASNWPKVRSSCAELSFIARSFRFAPGDQRRDISRCGASHLEVVNAKLGHPARPT